ncbi:Primosomal protein N' [Candidatus Erwinia haradaeae]|uniref:Replication restart protein PriA n=1 Tax=Candidatus Erwinia haradaeae TaxID=1922217 RepID=A0A451DDM2_9GAMM|nr:primosomal protein N' [Candidatus Erwinia haradaeae]VFP84586.1 Primosomal protein N' [Candidatus Erwinia haradaeae]
MYIVQVALPVSQTYNLNYVLPKNVQDVVIGGRIRVPFRNRQMIGIVVKTSRTCGDPLLQLPIIHEILDTHSLYHSNLWRTLILAAEYYHYSLGNILFYAIPLLLRRGYLLESILDNKSIGSSIIENKKTYKHIPFALKKEQLPPLYSNNLFSSHGLNQDSFNNVKNVTQQLNLEQYEAVTTIQNTDNKFITWLLHGLSESGQTNIYFNVLENILTQGKQAIILVPEINLTPETTSLVLKRFHVQVDALHSNLNHHERLNVWRRAREGKTDIVIGTRSVVFTPFTQLGIIIIYEEHASSYIQKDGCPYHARDLAILRARQENIPIIIGSATPALETLHNVQLGKYRQIVFKENCHKIGPAKRILVDLQGLQLQAGLSPILINKMHRHLEEKHQVFLFLHHHSFSPALLCQECRWIPKCIRCERNFVLYRRYNQLRCLYCNGWRRIPRQCWQCDSTYILPVGLCIEQIENYLTTLFPFVPLTYINHDTAGYHSVPENTLDKIDHGRAHILLSSKMIFKTHNLSNITLVSFVNADGVLFSSDFQASERFAQLYHYMARLAEGPNKRGEVILQTYHPENSLLNTLLHTGYDEFAKQELYKRKSFLLPPYTNQAIFCAEAYDNHKARQFLNQLMVLLKDSSLYNSSFRVAGPNPSFKAKIKGRYRWTMEIYHSSRVTLYFFIKHARTLVDTIPQGCHIKWSLRINSYDS